MGDDEFPSDTEILFPDLHFVKSNSSKCINAIFVNANFQGIVSKKSLPGIPLKCLHDK